MKRKILSSLLVITMITTIFAGCGKKEESSSNATASNDSKVEVQQEETDKEDSNNVAETTGQESIMEESTSSNKTEMIVLPNPTYSGTITEEFVYSESDTITAKYVYDDTGVLDGMYLYDENENVIQYFEIDRGGNNYKYDESGNCIEENYFMINGNAIEIFREISYEYDSNGNMIHKVQGSDDYNYKYDENGKLICEENGNKQKLYEYDENGNLLKTSIYDEYSLYECDTNGNILKESCYDSNNELYLVKVYNENMEYESWLDYKDGQIYSGYESIYDDKGNISKITYYGSNATDYYDTRSMEYDNEGRIIASKAYKDEENDTSGHTYTYTYNSDGKIDAIIHECSEYKDETYYEYMTNGYDKNIILKSSMSSTQQKQEYQHDMNGLITKIIVSSISEDGETKISSMYEFSYNSNGINSVTITKGDIVEVISFQ